MIVFNTFGRFSGGKRVDAPGDSLIGFETIQALFPLQNGCMSDSALR
jgi:hypothetical protein